MKIFSVIVRLWILSGYGIYAFRFDSDTEKILCTNQCNAFCLESQYRCSFDFLECSAGNETTKSYWMTNCEFANQSHHTLNEIPNCIGTCNTLQEHFDYTRTPKIPEVTLEDVTGTHVELSWQPSNSVFIVYYVVQMRAMGNSSWTNVISKARLTRFKISVPDPCGQYDFRVMAINEYGSNGFSSPVRVSKFVPGPVPNITYADQGMYYRPGRSSFMGIIQWSNIPGWSDSDIQSYYWNPNPHRICKSMDQSIQPLFRDATHGKNQVLMEFHEDAFGCSYETQVRAISRCGVTGIWTNFTVDLSDCRFLQKFPCHLYPDVFSPPGKVQNVSISADRGGRKVMIKLQWFPPDDLGSMGKVDHYFIRWGQVSIIDGLMLPDFINEPNVTRVPWDSVEFYVQVERNFSADYGFQIIPMAPNQQMTESEWGLFTVYVIEVSPAGKSKNNRMGTVLLDDSEVRVMKVHNTVDVEVTWHIVQNRDLRRNKSRFYERYAVQWGKVKPDKMSNDSQLAEKNFTIVPSVCYDYTILLCQSWFKVELEA